MLHKFIIKLLILFVLSSQFATMLHAVEHQFEEDEHESCSICIHEFESKNLLLDSNDFKNFDINNHEKITGTIYSFYLIIPLNHNARSPPSPLI